MTIEMLKELVKMKNNQETDEQCAKHFNLSRQTIIYWVRKLRKANKIAPAIRGSKSQINIKEI
jgi:transposase